MQFSMSTRIGAQKTQLTTSPTKKVLQSPKFQQFLTVPMVVSSAACIRMKVGHLPQDGHFPAQDNLAERWSNGKERDRWHKDRTGESALRLDTEDVEPYQKLALGWFMRVQACVLHLYMDVEWRAEAKCESCYGDTVHLIL